MAGWLLLLLQEMLLQEMVAVLHLAGVRRQVQLVPFISSHSMAAQATSRSKYPRLHLLLLPLRLWPDSRRCLRYRQPRQRHRPQLTGQRSLPAVAWRRLHQRRSVIPTFLSFPRQATRPQTSSSRNSTKRERQCGSSCSDVVGSRYAGEEKQKNGFYCFLFCFSCFFFFSWSHASKDMYMTRKQKK